MRITSTTESIESNEISVLSIAETILAVSISIYIIITIQSLLPIFLSLLLAPFLLLKTSTSTNFGLKLFRIFSPIINTEKLFLYTPICSAVFSAILTLLYLWVYWDYITDLSESYGGWYIFFLGRLFGLVIFISFLFYFAIICVSIVSIYLICIVGILLSIKFIAAAYGLIKSPRDTLIAIPKNWFKIAFCTDIFSPPEVFTGVNKDPILKKMFGIREFFPNTTNNALDAAYEGGDIFGENLVLQIPFLLVMYTVVLLSIIFVVCFLYLPGILYRVNLKSTSIAYLPFLYILHIGEISFARLRAKDLFKFASEQKIAVFFSYVTLLSHTALPVIIIFVFGFVDAYTNSKNLPSDLLGYFSFYPVVNLVAISKILNSGIVLASVGLAKYAFEKYELLNQSTVKLIKNSLRLLILCRTILTTYSIIVFVYILSIYVDWNHISHALMFTADVTKQIEFDFRLLPKIRGAEPSSG